MKNDIDDAQKILEAKYKMAMEIIIKTNQSWNYANISAITWFVADKFHGELESRSENLKLDFLEKLDVAKKDNSK